MKVLRAAPVLLAAILSCVQSPGTGAAPEVVREAGLRVGLAVEPPWAFFDSLGRATGEAPEVLRAVARELDIDDIRWLPLEFQELPGALHAGRIDVIAAGMYITEERARSLRFSVPTLCVGPALVQSAENPREVSLEGRVPASSEVPDAADGGDAGDAAVAEGASGAADAAGAPSGSASSGAPSAPDASDASGESGAAGQPGASDADCRLCRISILEGSVEQAAVEALGVEPRRLLVVPDIPTGVAVVRSGDVGALLTSEPTARRLARRDASLVVRELPADGPALSGAEGCAAFAFRPEDEALAAAFDEVLAAWLGTGPHLEIVRAFGFKPADVAFDPGASADRGYDDNAFDDAPAPGGTP